MYGSELCQGFACCEYTIMINFKSICTKKFSMSSFVRWANSWRCQLLGNVGDKGTMKDRIVFKFETKGRIISGIGTPEPPGEDWDKRNNIKSKIGRMEFTDIGRNRLAIASSNKVCNIGRHVCNRKIIHSIIKLGMRCNFNLQRLCIIP